MLSSVAKTSAPGPCHVLRTPGLCVLEGVAGRLAGCYKRELVDT